MNTTTTWEVTWARCLFPIDCRTESEALNRARSIDNHNVWVDRIYCGSRRQIAEYNYGVRVA